MIQSDLILGNTPIFWEVSQKFSLTLKMKSVRLLPTHFRNAFYKFQQNPISYGPTRIEQSSKSTTHIREKEYKFDTRNEPR